MTVNPLYPLGTRPVGKPTAEDLGGSVKIRWHVIAALIIVLLALGAVIATGIEAIRQLP